MNHVSARRDHRHLAMGSALIALAFVALFAFAARAQAATEKIYWDNFGGSPDNIAFASIDGSGGGVLNTSGNVVEEPEGMAYDSVTNRLFVATEAGANGEILAINLDGSGAAPFGAPGAIVAEPEGIAVDPVSRMIFWLNTEGEGSISWAKLDGSAGGTLNTTGTTVENACCRLAVDPTGGRVYWINNPAGTNSIGFANLNNTGGGGKLNTTGATIEPGEEGLAVDSAAGRVYFTKTGKFAFANVSGSGGGDVAVGSGVVNGPWGLAFDPSVSTLYWGNESNSTGKNINAIGFVNLAGVGAGITPVTAPVASPQDPVILKSPTGAGVPTVTRNSKERSKLACSTGSWAADYAGGFVYQAPRTFAYQWLRSGKAIGGATASTYNAKSGGEYSCAVTAANQTGSAVQTSAITTVKAAKLKLTTKKKANAKPGILATFKIKAVNQGDISAKAKVCVKLPKSAKGALKAPKCKSLGNLKSGAKKSTALRIKVLASAGGTYKVKFQVKGASGKAAKAKIIVG